MEDILDLSASVEGNPGQGGQGREGAGLSRAAAALEWEPEIGQKE